MALFDNLKASHLISMNENDPEDICDAWVLFTSDDVYCNFLSVRSVVCYVEDTVWNRASRGYNDKSLKHILQNSYWTHR